MPHRAANSAAWSSAALRAVHVAGSPGGVDRHAPQSRPYSASRVQESRALGGVLVSHCIVSATDVWAPASHDPMLELQPSPSAHPHASAKPAAAPGAGAPRCGHADPNAPSTRSRSLTLTDGPPLTANLSASPSAKRPNAPKHSSRSATSTPPESLKSYTSQVACGTVSCSNRGAVTAVVGATILAAAAKTTGQSTARALVVTAYSTRGHGIV